MAMESDRCALIEAVNQQEGDTVRSMSGTEVPISREVDKQLIDDIYEHCTDLNILLAGVSGSGKSSLANALVGLDQNVFEEGGNLDHCTENVTSRKGTKQSKNMKIWDTPGLLDEINSDEKYLNEIKKIVDTFEPGDLILFCIEVKSRFRNVKTNDDIQAMLMLQEKLDNRFSTNLVIVLTHADQIIARANGEKPKTEFYNDIIKDYKEKIRKALKDDLNLNAEMVKQIPIIPVQHHNHQEILPDGKRIYKSTLPDGTRWLSALWCACFHATSNNISKSKWIENLQDRIVDTPDPNTEKARHQIILLNDDFPETLQDYKKKYQKRGGLLGILGGPLMLITIPLGIWVGRQYGRKEYLLDLQDFEMKKKKLKESHAETVA